MLLPAPFSPRSACTLARAGTELGLAKCDDAAIAFGQSVDGDEVHGNALYPDRERGLPAVNRGEVRSYPDHLVPAASAAVMSTHSGVIGSVRPGAWSGNAFTPTS